MKLQQPATRVSESLIWSISDDFYSDAGPKAWSDGLVPQGITSNCAIADAYASIAAGFLRDLARQGCTEPALIIEAGGGSGRFAWQFLHRLRHHHLKGGPPAAAFTYLLTDGAASNIEYWKTLSRFIPLRESGILDFGRMLVADALEIHTGNSGVMTVAELSNRPVILIANYLHCSIRSDVFRVRGHTLYHEMVALAERDASGLAEQKTGTLHRLKPTFSSEERPGPPTGHPILDRILGDYRTLPGDHCIPVPETSIRFLENFLRRDAPFLHLSADLGYTEPVAIPPVDPFIFDHYLAIRTNFHMMGEVFRAYGGDVQFPVFDTPHFSTVALMYPGGCGQLEATALAARHVLRDFTPFDIHNLLKDFRAAEGPLPWRQTAGWLCLSKFDAEIARVSIPRLIQALPVEKRLNLDHLRDMYLEAYETYFPDGAEPAEFDLEIANLFLRVGLNAEALRLLERGAAESGRTAPRLYQLALTLIRLGRTDEALTAAAESFEADSSHEPTQRLVAAFQAHAAQNASEAA